MAVYFIVNDFIIIIEIHIHKYIYKLSLSFYEKTLQLLCSSLYIYLHSLFYDEYISRLVISIIEFINKVSTFNGFT